MVKVAMMATTYLSMDALIVQLTKNMFVKTNYSNSLFAKDVHLIVYNAFWKTSLSNVVNVTLGTLYKKENARRAARFV